MYPSELFPSMKMHSIEFKQNLSISFLFNHLNPLEGKY